MPLDEEGKAVPGSLRVKIATEEWEFREIHRLNHATFVDEIPQHAAQASGLLIDRFHHENTYFVAAEGKRIVGMLAIRGTRPFSLDGKLPNLDAYLPAGYRFCEVRLLAITKDRRSGRVLQHLLAALWQYSLTHGFDAAVISGTTNQLKMYRSLGFVPFGPLVGSPGAQFQPMFVTRARAADRFEPLARTRRACLTNDEVNLLPGPVHVRASVREAMAARPRSHRGAEFREDLHATRRLLSALTGAAHAAVMVGSGTLANDVIAAQLSLVAGRGVILVNGEFGHRLVDHATRCGLTFDVIDAPWGSPLDLDAVQRHLSAPETPAWLWFVHLETSTGVLNNLDAVAGLCTLRGVRLCVDAVSSTGLVPVDLGRAWFGSAVSGKGLGAFPGLSIVFHNHPVAPATRIPRYLDLGLYANDESVPFTHSSNLVNGLRVAIENVDWRQRHRDVAERSTRLRAELRQLGFDIVSSEPDAAPGVVTIALPPPLDSSQLEAQLAAEGYLFAAASEYLRSRNWMQISLMSLPSDTELDRAVEALCRRCSR